MKKLPYMKSLQRTQMTAAFHAYKILRAICIETYYRYYFISIVTRFSHFFIFKMYSHWKRAVGRVYWL